jgi:hypothetical protein
MAQLPRRAALLLPALFLPAAPHAATRVPSFPEWVGRTARLKSEAGEARLLLTADGAGLIAVRAFFACRPVPVLSWRIEPSGQAITYRRASALFPGRVIEGSATIMPEPGTLRWVERQEQIAEFQGFEAAASAARCG